MNRVARHLADWAASALVLIGLLLAAMALASLPAMVRLSIGAPATPPPAAAAMGAPSRAPTWT
jgi:hypothetical protein